MGDVDTAVLSAGAWLELELLAKRREQLGLARPKPILVRKLLLRGTWIGSVLPSLLLLVGLVLLIQDRFLIRQQEQLTPLANQYDAVEQQITELVGQIDAAKKLNQSIAVAMADVRSSSALLGELTRLTPREMTLESVKAEGNQLSLEGDALQPNGLRMINALLLRLAQSSFFDAKQVRLDKAEVQSAGEGMAPQMSFSLVAPFREEAASATRSRLAVLGAVGLAKRVKLLEAEQLLP